MATKRDYYEVLGVNKNATDKTKKLWYNLMRIGYSTKCLFGTWKTD